MNIIENIKNSIEDTKLNITDLEKAVNVGLPNPKVESWKYTPLTFPISNYKIAKLSDNQDKIELFKYIERYPRENETPIYILNGDIINIIPNLNKTKRQNQENFFIQDFFYYLNQSTNQENYSFQFDQNSENKNYSFVIGSLAEDENFLANTNLSFVVKKNTEFEIDIYFSNFSKKSFLQNNYFSFKIEENAKLKINILEEDQNHLNLINNFHFDLQDNSKLDLSVFIIDGIFTRNNFQVDINGQNCDALLNGLCLGTKKNVVDNHILVNHNMPNSHSNQFFKGILEEKSRGVFNGKVYVRKDAQKSNAYQSNKNMLTSTDAQIFTKPELEIYADDVKCSHGATSGFLQDNEMFYLMSRGISREESKSLLLKAFAHEVIERVNNSEYVDWLEKKIDDLI